MSEHHTYKSNDNRAFDRVLLPLPPSEPQAHTEMEIYARFMRHLRLVPNSRAEIKVLSAILFTADMMDLGDGLIAKTLVDLGLRAPRAAFPESWLEHVDRCLMRNRWEFGGPSKEIIELKKYWDAIGEDRFAAFRREFPRVQEPVTI